MGSVLTSIGPLAAISFDNEVRGLLTVLLGSAILMGSVWLIISTNTGFRLGSLIAISAIFGWTAMMALIWALYGIGLQGARPTWEVQAIHIGNPSVSDNEANPPPEILDNLPNPATCATLGDQDCLPKAIQIVRVLGDSSQRVELDSINASAIRGEVTAFHDELAANDPNDPRISTGDEIEAEVQRLASEQRIRNEDLTLSELKGIAPELTDEAERRGWLELGDWNLETTQAAGEAVTAASDYLVQADLGFGATDEQSNTFVVLDAFQKGGKPERLNNGVWERVSNKVITSAMPRHPTNYTVVQVQRSLYHETKAGQAPPPAEIDSDEPVISVLLRRNLGRFRLPGILVAIGSGLLFLVSLLMLHTRDLEVRRRLEGEGEGAAP
ncbi:hypothetical protein [Candidatus Poriferisocius sp.]|uniref:hypothetical protein n=1 Tax=Candidatus Poriferisocius sp. TaxID=3101276 RepID=UPI003B022346